ncbi:hypothetical protein GCM10007874_38190 [Labrys miyagiensis]|uniref:Uncharacterized protein n=1 Tax=Labrys miyagiensis TaxID=346912 RepID=A0ABQ6CRB3_9HYPH|nr:hypothetical protein GCM10007874_38190 [Labrys miyagiensis]
MVVKYKGYDESTVTINCKTGAITIDLVTTGPVRIVMTVDGDIEVEGRSILNTVIWSEFASRPATFSNN